MDLNDIKQSLSKLLGINEDAVFDYIGSGSCDLSQWAFNQLKDMIELPEGYVLTTTLRTPNTGEFFLDVSTLVSEERVVVYKALDTVSNVNLILSSEDVHKEEKKSGLGGFDLFLCMLQGGVAKYKDETVRLLLPAIDSSENVIILLSGNFKVVSVTELAHLNDLPDLSDVPASTNLLSNTGISDINLPKPKKDKYSNRFDINFDD
jgi:hypothetical protein